jgi:copper chaperone
MEKNDFHFTVTGMTCGHCEMAIKKALGKADPQAQIQVDRHQNHVQIFQTEKTRETLLQIIAEEGYQVA